MRAQGPVAETCELHFQNADGFCVSTNQVFAPTDAATKDVLLAAILADQQITADSKGLTIIHTDDAAKPHVCKVRPLTPNEVKAARLAELRARPWSALVKAEQLEATDLAFQLDQTVPAITALA
jgi:hypothetical protein